MQQYKAFNSSYVPPAKGNCFEELVAAPICFSDGPSGEPLSKNSSSTGVDGSYVLQGGVPVASVQSNWDFMLNYGCSNLLE